jgi:phosphatidylinositol-3-phosphatase
MRRLAPALAVVAVCVSVAGALFAPRLKPPSSLTAAAGDQAITLTWPASTSSGVTKYRVYRKAANGKWPRIPVATTRALTYVDAGLVNGTAYTYRVTSVAGRRESRPSSRANATPTPANATPTPAAATPTPANATPTPSAATGPCGRAGTPPARYDHVVWVVMENKAYGSIIGSASAPYENKLAAQCGSAVNFFAETHPSLPNYIAMTSGSPQGISDDDPPSSHPLDVPSIFSQLGTNWRSLQESMQSNCLLTSSGVYAVKHNPAAYYTNIRSDCGVLDVPLADPPDVSAKFTFVTPNRCNDTHDCSVATGDAWLQTFLGEVFASPEYQAGTTAVFMTWDEDDGSDSNHIATIVAAPSVTPGTAPTATFDHYSMLRTTEEMLGLGLIGNAASAPSMRAAFGV